VGKDVAAGARISTAEPQMMKAAQKRGSLSEMIEFQGLIEIGLHGGMGSSRFIISGGGDERLLKS